MLKPRVTALAVPVVILALAVIFVAWPRSSAEGVTSTIPLQLSGAFSAVQARAFPSDDAGIAAYLKVAGFDHNQLVEPLDRVDKKGDNFTLGTVTIGNLGGSNTVWVYGDHESWLVAYLQRGAPTANAIQWIGAGVDVASITDIRTVLEDGLRKVLEPQRISFDSLSDQVAYYHFGYPQASSLAVFALAELGCKGNELTAAIPREYIVDEVSIGLVSRTVRGRSVQLDGAEVLQLSENGVTAKTIPIAQFSKGETHHIATARCSSSGSGYAAIALTLVYSP